MSVDTFQSSAAGQNSGGQEEGSRLPVRSRGVPSSGGGGPEELSNTEEEHLAKRRSSAVRPLESGNGEVSDQVAGEKHVRGHSSEED